MFRVYKTLCGNFLVLGECRISQDVFGHEIETLILDKDGKQKSFSWGELNKIEDKIIKENYIFIGCKGTLKSSLEMISADLNEDNSKKS